MHSGRQRRKASASALARLEAERTVQEAKPIFAVVPAEPVKVVEPVKIAEPLPMAKAEKPIPERCRLTAEPDDATVRTLLVKCLRVEVLRDGTKVIFREPGRSDDWDPNPDPVFFVRWIDAWVTKSLAYSNWQECRQTVGRGGVAAADRACGKYAPQ